ncbi:MAG: hypothetical protein DI537_20685 [Stutzerimonas stutzeri]|nr:MAG: hypothetical protein DI537_20685 [Stutzerimonas stutzeri]
MTNRLSFDALRDNIVDSHAFQRACQRYAHGNGSSEAIAMAVLTAVGFPDLYADTLRYRFLREKWHREDGMDLDSAIDNEIDALASCLEVGQ